MASPLQYTFLTSKHVSGIKMDANRLLCDSSAAALTSLLPARKEVRDIRREGQKREILSDTLS